jgi:hypothetical protein
MTDEQEPIRLEYNSASLPLRHDEAWRVEQERRVGGWVWAFIVAPFLIIAAVVASLYVLFIAYELTR